MQRVLHGLLYTCSLFIHFLIFQFPDCVDFAEEMANSGKIVIVAALDGTFQRVGFGDILRLIPMAESVVKLKAVCMACFSDASFTKRTTLEKEVRFANLTLWYVESHSSNKS